MHPSPKMQHIIEQLAQQHGVDLYADGASFRLEMPGFDRLCVENIGSGRISVAHYFEQHGDLVADPEVVFYHCPEGWMAVEITQVLTGWCAVGTDVRAQADVASFGDWWAQNLIDQGWLTDGTRTR